MNDCSVFCEKAFACIPVENPQSMRRRTWDLLIFALVLWTIIVIPLQIGFRPRQTTAWIVQDQVINFIFLLDIIYNFSTAYIDRRLNLVTNKAKIAKHYLSTWFFPDLIATFPFDLIGLLVVQQDSNEFTVFSILKAPRLLRLGKFMRFVERMKNASGVKIAQLIVFFFLFAHWIGCGYFLIGSLVNQDRSWITKEEDLKNMDDFAVAYWTSLHKALIIMMGEDMEPDNIPERVFVIISLLIGALYWATIVGIVSFHLIASLCQQALGLK